jgi:hypothetical protein
VQDAVLAVRPGHAAAIPGEELTAFVRARLGGRRSTPGRSGITSVRVMLRWRTSRRRGGDAPPIPLPPGPDGRTQWLEASVTSLLSGLERVEDRLERLERRMGEVEDVALPLGPADGVDDVRARLDLLAASAASHDELLEARLEATRVSTAVERLAAEVRTLAERGGPGLGDDPDWAASA